MTDPPPIGNGARLHFMSPLSGERADRLVGELAAQAPATAIERLAKMWPGTSADDCTDLAGLVDHAIGAGFRPLRIETATRAEREECESGLAADMEEWLLSHPTMLQPTPCGKGSTRNVTSGCVATVT